ncbi:MAG TPA: tetratricopeptide repeat protein [Pyrinomonadaceae bacterium]|nr:tetratricopeptide repeat protein [Pyrinomonadaceae bacterium]
MRLRRKLRRARRKAAPKSDPPAEARARGASRAPCATALGLVALLLLGAAAAFGCGWFGTEHSVRFNAWHDERLFGRLPPLPFDARERTRPDYRQEDEGQESGQYQDPRKQADVLWSRAGEDAARGDLGGLRKRLDEFLQYTGGNVCADFYDTAGLCRRRRNSARDQLDALASNARAVGAYLEARRAYDDWLATSDGAGDSCATPEAVEAALGEVPRGAGLDDNVAYLRAALLFERGEWRESIGAFERLAARHPRSEKREAALFNAGLLWMKGGRAGLGVEHAASDEACPDCEDEEWQRAVAAFRRLLGEYPRGTYAGDARGWLAFLHVRVGRRAEGLAEYYRMLADEEDPAAQGEALRSLRLVRDDATEGEMERVGSLIEREPRVALAYAYHEIYNAALGDGFRVEVPEEVNPYRWCRERDAGSNCSGDFYRWQDEERVRREGALTRKSFARVVAFATRLMRRLPASDAGGAFALRVAQADLELGEDEAARELAGRALASGLKGNERAAALWVRGVAEYRLGQFDASRRTFSSLLKEYPEGDLTEGARRFVAMAAEGSGDLEGALEQYLLLEYQDDVAYFVDVLLTPEQLEAFAERRADAEARDVLFYSLGVRLMRAHRFDEARRAYARVRTADDLRANPYEFGGKCEEDYPPPYCEDVKNPRWQDWEGVQAAWVLRDLKTMERIEHLEARARDAAGAEARAEALYRLASYLYQSGDLTFYNPAAWRGRRFYDIYYDQQFRAPGEAALMRRYMEEHEPLVRALRIYLQVAEEFPRTRAARDSLYTAAVIHQRLAGFELYWPRQYAQGLYPGGRFVTYADVRRAYPDYRLPHGTYGWEPLTRTVRGREAWPAPPKPKKLTGMERARLKLKRAEVRVGQAWELFGEVYGGRVRRWTVAALLGAVVMLRWSVVALVALAVLCVFRRTRRARHFLYRQLLRHIRRPPAVYAPSSSYAAHEAYAPYRGLGGAFGRAVGGLLRLTLRERGRAALALNLFTHALLTLLMWAVLWAMQK